MKIVFTDLDKTLLNDNQQISDVNLSAINYLIKNGHTVVFSSGRSYINIKTEILDKYNLELPVSALNGAQIYSKAGDLIKSSPIKTNILSEIIDICNKNELFYLLFSDSNTYAKPNKNMMKNLYLLAKEKTNDLETILKGMQIYYDLFYKYEKLDEDVETKFKTGKKELYKIEIVSHKKNILNSIKAIIPNDLHVTNSNSENLEITQGKINKGVSLDFLCDYFNIPLTESYAIGDNKNDIEMIKKAQYGSGVGNAIDEIKEIADYIADDYDKNGFADFVKHYF